MRSKRDLPVAALPRNRRREIVAPERPVSPKLAGGEGLRKLVTRYRGSAVLVIKLALLLAGLAGAVWLARHVEAHVRSAEAFATKTITIIGAERLSEEEIREAAMLAIGQNIFDVAPEDAQAHLLEHPWIAEASVERRLPDGYSIRIRERRAAALLLMDRLYLVSEEGTVFKRAEPADELDLPVITGVDREQFVSDRTYRASIVLEVVALMHDYRGAGLWRREPVSEVHVEADDGLSLYVGDDGMLVRLGRGPFREKLARLRQVLDRLQQEEVRAEYIYVDNVRRPDRITVKPRDLMIPIAAVGAEGDDA